MNQVPHYNLKQLNEVSSWWSEKARGSDKITYWFSNLSDLHKTTQFKIIDSFNTNASNLLQINPFKHVVFPNYESLLVLSAKEFNKIYDTSKILVSWFALL